MNIFVEILLIISVVLLYGVAILSLIYVFLIATSLRKETPFVPLEHNAIRYALSILNLDRSDRFVDIGSGDGRVVRRVVREYSVASATGVEYNYGLYTISRVLDFVLGGKGSYIHSDAFKLDYAKYTKVFLYVTSDMLDRLLPKLLEDLPVGSKVISVYFKPRVKLDVAEVLVKKYRINGKIKDFYIITKKTSNENTRRKKDFRENTKDIK